MALPFAILDGAHTLALDISKLNTAGQWDIINATTGDVVTLTMASFWSNKVFAWLDHQREIWAPHEPE